MALPAFSAVPGAPSLADRWDVIRRTYFQSRTAGIVTVLVGLVCIAGIATAVDWAILSATWRAGGPEACAASSGACWAFVREKWQVMLLGAFPQDEIWRPFVGAGMVLATLILLGALRWPLRLSAALLVAAFICLFALLDGRPLGLVQVEMVRWHGIAVVSFLGVFSLFAAFPIGILLALARVDGPPVLSGLATGYIEAIRAVPLVTVLFFGVFVLPLLLPPSLKNEPLLVTLLALVLFHAAYIAEDIRGGGYSPWPRGSATPPTHSGWATWRGPA